MNKRSNIILSIVTIVFGVIFLTFSMQIPVRSTGGISPAFWPTTLMIGLIILGSLLLLQSVKKPKFENDSDVQGFLSEEPKEENEGGFAVYLVVGILVGYILLLNVIGFILSTFLLIYSTAFVLKMRNKKALLLASFAGTALLVVLFPIVLGTPLPRGTGIFTTFTQMFY